MFGKEHSMDTQNREDREKTKIEDEMTYWYKNPIWIQTGFIGLILLGFIALNWESLSYSITTAVNNIVHMRLQDLFAVAFVLDLLAFAYFVLVQIWTGGITNKLIYAKLFKKRTMWYLGEDNVKRLVIPNTKKPGWWKVKGLGEWKTLKRAMYWMENGTLCMDTIEGHAEGVCLSDVRDQCILKTDPSVFEKRNDAAVLEGIEISDSPFKKLDLMTILPIMMMLAIVGYIVIIAMQGNECQANLVSLAKTCGETAKGVYNVTSTTLAPGKNIVSMMK